MTSMLDEAEREQWLKLEVLKIIASTQNNCNSSELLDDAKILLVWVKKNE